jgi:hypothetical protein
MFLPFESSLSFWLSETAIYSWEPEPPVMEPASSTGDAQVPEDLLHAGLDGAASSMPMGLPAMRLVFKGVTWTTYPVFGMRENVAWEQVSQTHRDVDEEHRDDNQRQARKTRPPVPPTKTD